ncbi:hypothetical protein [Algivirga pacifica]|uniref:DUF4412 domain-containing protein n=1 Tax=Algivirga pacifica TaxID=1162670 RepID=A0ABP9DIJ2_9BACT
MRFTALSLIIAIAITHSVFGTQQIPEKIIYKGDTLALLSLPFEEKLETIKNKTQIHTRLGKMCSTALYRGYTGLWKIEHGELYLIDIDICGDPDKSFLDRLFPGQQLPIKATWFTGELYIQEGKRLYYSLNPTGFGGFSDKEAVITITNGNQTDLKYFYNGPKATQTGMSSDFVAVVREVYRNIDWINIKSLSEDYKLTLVVRLNTNTPFTIKGDLQGIYRKELENVIDSLPPLQPFLIRGKTPELGYLFPIIFSQKMKDKFGKG